jgi:hypothetical protein
VGAFVDTILDGPHNGLRLDGDEDLVRTCFERLHSILWGASPQGSAAAAEGLADGDDSPELAYS